MAAGVSLESQQLSFYRDVLKFPRGVYRFTDLVGDFVYGKDRILFVFEHGALIRVGLFFSYYPAEHPVDKAAGFFRAENFCQFDSFGYRYCDGHFL